MKILVISDIHGNAEALRAVMHAEADADASIFLGDALLSGPQANETMELLEQLDPDLAVRGNHDDELLNPSLFQGWPPEWVALNEWILEHLDPAAVTQAAEFTEPGRYQLGELDACLHHGDLGSRELAAIPDADEHVFELLRSGNDTSLVLFGHTHVQFSHRVGATRFINPGSVGQSRCGVMHACYGVFEDGEYQPRQVAYDPAPWLAALERIDVLEAFPDFKQWLINGLLSGYGIGKREPWTRFAAQGYH